MTARWLVFRFAPVTLFSLKLSQATSTAGKTLLTPTPYSIKMAFLDASLRHGLAGNPEVLVRQLAKASVRIGVPEDACVTGTVQSIRQEKNDEERKRHPELSKYRGSIAMREFVHFRGALRIAFDVKTCPQELVKVLLRTAPTINYFGKRGSFVQYRDFEEHIALGLTFTFPASEVDALELQGQRVLLDDFGTKASFEALNSFNANEVKPGIHRAFVETIVPLVVHNSGPSFVHFRSLNHA